MVGKQAFSRADRSPLGQWWWTVDRWILWAAVGLLALGALLSVSASPMVATRIGLEYFFFVKRHLLLLGPALVVLIGTSLLNRTHARYLAWVVFFASLLFLILTPILGAEIKGSRRWVTVMGFSLQASEFMKPSFAVIAGWLFSKIAPEEKRKFWGVGMGFYVAIITLLMLQPDFGMAFVTTGIWGVQLFLAGLPFYWIAMCLLGGGAAVMGAYFCFPHVASRINRFWGEDQGDLYQVTKSLEALKHGGIFGQGPGEGVMKRHLPDAHADFVFSVAGEEFGYLFCLMIIALYLIILIRGFFHIYREYNLFIILAVSGLLMQYALQALINIASSLHLIPTKGMTLPFLSYGGSSLLAVSFGVGLLLSLTRKTET